LKPTINHEPAINVNPELNVTIENSLNELLYSKFHLKQRELRKFSPFKLFELSIIGAHCLEQRPNSTMDDLKNFPEISDPNYPKLTDQHTSFTPNRSLDAKKFAINHRNTVSFSNGCQKG
jgi:hypothetical protein